MNIEKFLLRSEDEMDFLPIIPLNESDQEDLNGIEIPAEIALLPLRNTVLFPGVVLPITVGRDKSIKAVNDAYKGDKLIGVVAQKDSNVEDPEVKDLEAIGTVAKIVKLIKMPDGGTTIIIRGKSRFLRKILISGQKSKNWMKKSRLRMKISMLMLLTSKTWRQILFSFHPIFLRKLLLFSAILKTLLFLSILYRAI